MHKLRIIAVSVLIVAAGLGLAGVNLYWVYRAVADLVQWGWLGK